MVGSFKKSSQSQKGSSRSNSVPAHAKDVSEHTSSVRSFYAEPDEFDLSELAPPPAPKQHWWDNDYVPVVEEGHSPKVRSLSALVKPQDNSSSSQDKSSPKDGDFTDSADNATSDNAISEDDYTLGLTPLRSFDPIAYRRNKKQQPSSTNVDSKHDIKTARDLVCSESYRTRLQKSNELKAEKQAQKTQTTPVVFDKSVPYADFVQQQRDLTLQQKEEQAAKQALAAVTPWESIGKPKTKDTRLSRLLQRKHSRLETMASQFQSTQVSNSASPSQGALGSSDTSLGSEMGVTSSVSAGNQESVVSRPVSQGRTYSGKVPYQTSFASQNVFGSSSDDTGDFDSVEGSNSSNGSKGKLRGGLSTKKSGCGKRTKSKKTVEPVDYGDSVSCVSGWGVQGAGADCSHADDIDSVSASVSSIGGESETKSFQGKGKYAKRSYTRKTYGKSKGAGADNVKAKNKQPADTADSEADDEILSDKALAAAAKIKQAELSQAFNYIVRLLARREYSQTEIRKKMKGRFSDEMIETALQRCIEASYQSDTRHAEMLVRHMQFSSYGPHKLFMEARMKGADMDEVKRLSEDVDWDEIAYQALQRKFTTEQMQDNAVYAKALSYLARRGFSSSSSFAAARRLQKGDKND